MQSLASDFSNQNTYVESKDVPLWTRIVCAVQGHIWKPGYGFSIQLGWGCRTKTCSRCERTYFRICVGSDGEDSW